MAAKTYDEKLKETEKKMNDYFLCCDSLNEEAHEKKKIVKPYTLSGLLCFVGLTRKEFEKLLSKKKYADIFNRALSRIEAFTEEKALTGDLSASAAANTLKYNFGWNDYGQKEEAVPNVLKIVLDGELMKLAE